MAIFSALSGVISQQGAQAGGNMAASAANRAAQMQQDEATRARAALSPWVAAGGGALGTLKTNCGNYNTYGLDPAGAEETQQQALADFETSPGYQFRMDEGSKALDRSAASRGLLRSGAQQKAITAFGQGVASEEYGNYMDDLLAVSGLGGQAASSGNNTAAGLTANASDNIFRGGVARGSAYSAGANALASGISKGVENAAGVIGYKGWF